MVFLCVGIVAIGVSLWHWRVNIYKPFLVTDNNTSVPEAQTSVDEFNELLATQQKDTDNDGLTDYFETNIYGTSAYLPDTDSDGLSDKLEVDTGTNPLCPEGQQCGTLTQPGVGVDAIAENLLLQPSIDTTGDNPGAQLRALLQAEGVDDSILGEYSDEELLLLYDQVTQTQGTDDGLDQISSEQELLSGDIDPATLRDLLEQGGIERETLDQIPDEELLDIYNQVIAQESTQ